mmetsp:Transcript_5109/g.10291  ORF Transcript_5109/g.10291 Transcript_5109/m.10291 type:complete len:363 (-) Transcript_5109:379-1467(-)
MIAHFHSNRTMTASIMMLFLSQQFLPVTSSADEIASAPSTTYSNTVELHYKSKLCLAPTSAATCTTIMNNLDQSQHVFQDAILSTACDNEECKPQDAVQIDSFCGKPVIHGESDARKTKNSHRRLRPKKSAQDTQENEPLCIEFNIQMHAESGSDATAIYSHLNYIFETEPAQVETMQSIQKNLNSLAGDHFPEFVNGHNIEIASYQHISYSTIGLASNWYPDWGHSETCRNDGAEPVYMADSPSFITLTKEDCCAKHYYWKLNDCLNEASNVVTVMAPCTYISISSASPDNSTGSYYPDWSGGRNICTNDARAPEYMEAWPEAWIFNTIDDCCSQHFPWDLEACLSAHENSTPCEPTVVTF